MGWMLMPLRRYAQFFGRSQRKEFWMFMLLMFIIYFVLVIAGVIFSFSALATLGQSPNPLAAIAALGPLLAIVGIFWLVVIVPTLAVSVRRLHDVDRTGWWVLVAAVPSILRWIFLAAGIINTALIAVLGLVGLGLNVTLLVFYCTDGTRGSNRFGPDPKGPDLVQTFA